MGADDEHTTQGGSDRGHHLWEDLAIGHVLGGLDQKSSSNFRDHLIGCGDCRRHVAELRGIATDLQHAEREERAVVRTRVQAEEAVEATVAVHADRTTPRVLRNLLIFVLAFVLTVVAFWNVHLRELQRALEGSLEARGEVLDILVEGEELPLTSVAAGLRVRVVATASAVAINGDGLRALAVDERVVLWALGDQAAAVQVAHVGESGTPGGRVVMSGPLASSSREVLVTIEAWPLPDRPAGEVLLRASLG